MAAAVPTAAFGAPDPVLRWRSHASEASARFGVPIDWIERVIRAESGGRTTYNGRPTTSSAGAMGLMQLMPGTWQEMRSRHGLGPDPHDPRDNILAGTAYLRAMYERFGYPGVFAAYNAGPARFSRHLATGRALPAETRFYVGRITGGEGSQSAARILEPAPPRLFAIRRSRTSAPLYDAERPVALFFPVGASAHP
ncbi:lytic transglycosylase domain-containing protein [Sphingosinicella sp. BN140058]|uniref:lytic transglycosylase domain-containing protein n=1 Tax=Sphingosinicella sp. BN140058 TaxID=1892855 RepID=UPI001010516F|nr:lytic transglycosylase domain-containing protein [Sphingosinicella sp. BN140058]QAY78102.1 lytic transglycosylase domain-containing protein [Sphingosinicella sp. BN140058]